MYTHFHTLNTVPPDQAHALTVESSESTSISISWRPPTLTNLQILYYLISAVNLNSTSTVVGENDSITQVNTTSNVMLYNVTDLLPGTTYELTVVAVSRDIYRPEIVASMSQPSSSVTTTTGFTGISLNLCMYSEFQLNAFRILSRILKTS